MIKIIFFILIAQVSFAKSQKILSSDTKLTGYYPDDSALEGGFKDRYGHGLNTLQDFLAGKANYVSVAMDYKDGMDKYMKKYFCIPELEKSYAKDMSKAVKKKYKGHILFKAVDTGNAFLHKGWKKMDICVKDKKAAYEDRLNIHVSVVDCNHLASTFN